MLLKNQFAELIYPKAYDLDSIYESIETAARISYKSWMLFSNLGVLMLPVFLYSLIALSIAS